MLRSTTEQNVRQQQQIKFIEARGQLALKNLVTFKKRKKVMDFLLIFAHCGTVWSKSHDIYRSKSLAGRQLSVTVSACMSLQISLESLFVFIGNVKIDTYKRMYHHHYITYMHTCAVILESDNCIALQISSEGNVGRQI